MFSYKPSHTKKLLPLFKHDNLSSLWGGFSRTILKQHTPPAHSWGNQMFITVFRM